MKQVTLTRFFKRKEPLNESNTPQKESDIVVSSPKTPITPKTPKTVATPKSKATPKTPVVPLDEESEEEVISVKRIRTDKENARQIVDSDDEMEESLSKAMDLKAFRMTPKGTNSQIGTPRTPHTVATPKSTKVSDSQLVRKIQGKE
jgi:hypothetical protein